MVDQQVPSPEPPVETGLQCQQCGKTMPPGVTICPYCDLHRSSIPPTPYQPDVEERSRQEEQRKQRTDFNTGFVCTFFGLPYIYVMLVFMMRNQLVSGIIVSFILLALLCVVCFRISRPHIAKGIITAITIEAVSLLLLYGWCSSMH